MGGSYLEDCAKSLKNSNAGEISQTNRQIKKKSIHLENLSPPQDLFPRRENPFSDFNTGTP